LGKILLIIVLLLSTPFCLFELYRSAAYAYGQIAGGLYNGYLFLAVGMAACAVLANTLLRKNKALYQTMVHEGAHMLVGGFLLRHTITSFNATAKSGGGVSYMGRKNILMSLAPYYLPYLTFALLLVRLMIKPECLFIIDILIGVTLMFHIGCSVSQTHSYQPDIRNHGIMVSYLFITTLAAFNLALIIYSLGFSGSKSEPVDILNANVLFFKQSYADITNMIHHIAKTV